jgi:signal transduction histidine kinase
VLFLEDNPGDVRLIEEALRGVVGRARFTLEHVDRLSKALARLAEGGIDVLLTDLLVPDSRGLETLTKELAQKPAVPIVVLTGTYDEGLGIEAVRAGAQDHLIKERLDGEGLARALQYAVERGRAEAALRRAYEDLRQAHEALKSTQLELIQAAKMQSVGRLAAGVAHEVKNPLAIILVGVNYLANHLGPLNGRFSQVLHDVQDAVHRADVVINGLLDFSSSHTLELRSDSLNDVIEQALLLVKHELSSGRLEVVKQLAPELPPVRIDRQKIQQALVNLLMNAIQAMPPGGTVTLTTSFDPTASDVVVDVADTGTGIPADKLQKIFEPFFTTKPTGQGTGLGLTVTRRIVGLHGGSIEIANRPEGGVRARLIFPLSPAR